MKTTMTLLGLMLFCTVPARAEIAGVATDPESFERALSAARVDTSVPFGLEAACRDEGRHRVALVFPSGVGVWDRTVEVRVDGSIRKALIDDLLDAGFARFESRYGGQDKPEKAEAPLRILCRITVEAGGLAKTSVQALYGEQSAALAALAGSLLDRLEPLAAEGVTAGNLEEALGMLARGALAPETLVLRLLRLPPGSQGEASGEIVRLDGLRGSRQAYSPGRVVDAPQAAPTSPAAAARIAVAAAEAGFTTLPVNVFGTGYTELEIEVLGHARTVIARDFMRAAAGDESARFERLVEAIVSELAPQ